MISVLKWPEKRKNNTKLIGDVLSDALTRVFQDQTIGRQLGQ
jgi:uncharacterized lipoprotein